MSESGTENVLPNLNRVMPADIEAESGLISCVLQDPRLLADLRTKGGADLLFDYGLRLMLEGLEELDDERKPLDPVLLTNRLRDKRNLDRVGGAARVSEVFAFVPIPSHYPHYLRIVITKAAQRKGLGVLAESMHELFEFGRHDGGEETLLTVLERASGRVFETMTMLMERSSHRGMQHIAEIIPEAIEHIQMVIENRGHVTLGLATGFTDLDRLTMGLKGGQMIVLAGRPGKGKTVVGMKILRNIGCGEGDYPEFKQAATPGGVFELEMPAKALALRVLASKAKINMLRLRDGHFGRKDQDSIAHASRVLVGSKIYVEAAFGLTWQALRVKARQAVQRYGLKILVIDYMQLLGSATRNIQGNRQAIVAEVSTGIKALAMELDIPIIVLAQLNRDAEDRTRPKLSDLRESGQIEQDADLIGILCDVNMESDETGGYIGLDIVKHRDGPVTSDGDPLLLRFEKQYFDLISTTEKLASNNDAKRQQAPAKNGGGPQPGQKWRRKKEPDDMTWAQDFTNDDD